MLYSDLDENGVPKEMYCYEYSMNEVPATEGNIVDYNQLSNIDWYVRKCPAFANNGCFRGNITVRATGLAINAFNKGPDYKLFDMIIPLHGPFHGLNFRKFQNLISKVNS